MTILYYFLKKIGEKKVMLLSCIILAIGVFLSTLFLNLGWNTTAKIYNLNVLQPNYTLIVAQTNDKSGSMIDAKEQGYLSASVQTGAEHLSKIGDISIDASVTQYSADSDAVYFAKNMIAGSADRLKNGIWIGKSLLESLDNAVSAESIIGKEVTSVSGKLYTVVGVYDDSDDVISEQCIAFTEEAIEPSAYFLDVNSVDNVKTVEKELTERRFKVFSREEEIVAAKGYIRSIEIGVFILSLLGLTVSAFILYSTLKASFTDKYRYLALLKAIGYTKAHYRLFVFAESFIIFGIGAVLSVISYVFGMPGIQSLLRVNGVDSLFEVPIGDLFTTRYGIFALVIVLTAVAVAIVAILCIRLISRKQIHEILFEGNQ